MPIFYLMTDNTGLSNLWLNKTSSCSWKALIMSSINEGCCSAFVNRFCISDSRSLTSTLLRCFTTICRQAISLTNGFIALFAVKIFDNSLSVPTDVIWLAEINSIQIRNLITPNVVPKNQKWGRHMHNVTVTYNFSAKQLCNNSPNYNSQKFCEFQASKISRPNYPPGQKWSGPPVPAAGEPGVSVSATYNLLLFATYRNRTVRTLTKKQKGKEVQRCWLAGTKKWKGSFES